MWEDFFEKYKVEVLGPQGQQPTEEDMAEAEMRLGVSLPASYREFCQMIGAGILRDWIRIYAPCKEPKYADLVAYAEDARQGLPDADHPLAFPFPVKDLIAFADTMAGDCFGFYPKERTEEGEDPIYVMLSEPPPTVIKVASSFTDFIEHVVFGKRLLELQIYTDEDELPRTWEPFT
jgi:hypothetical protein